MIIIGIDTAIRKTGYGVLELTGAGSLKVLDCGVIANPAKMPHSECLRRLSGGIRELIETFHPDAASIEGAFASRNIKTAMILSLARGAVIAKLAEHRIPVYEYSPKTAKRAATGSGEASKEQVAASARPCSAAALKYSADFSNDCSTPIPSLYIHPRLYCAVTYPSLAARMYHFAASS